MPDLPQDLENLKEKGAPANYQPPYEAGQGFRQAEPKSEGEDIDYTETQDQRETNVPPIETDESPSGGVDLAFQAGEQGDDDLHGFKDPRKVLAADRPNLPPPTSNESDGPS